MLCICRLRSASGGAAFRGLLLRHVMEISKLYQMFKPGLSPWRDAGTARMLSTRLRSRCVPRAGISTAASRVCGEHDAYFHNSLRYEKTVFFCFLGRVDWRFRQELVVHGRHLGGHKDSAFDVQIPGRPPRSQESMAPVLNVYIQWSRVRLWKQCPSSCTRLMQFKCSFCSGTYVRKH